MKKKWYLCTLNKHYNENSFMEKIEIKGYKSIKDLTLELKPINILIGANGSGKSNFLSFFTLLRNIYARNLQQYVGLNGGADRFVHHGGKVTSSIYAKLHFQNTNAYSFELTIGHDGFVYTHEGLWYNKCFSMPPEVDISNYGTESTLQHKTLKRAEYIREYLRALQKYHFHDTSNKSPFTKTSNIEKDIFSLYEQGDNIAAFLYGIKVKAPKVYNFIVRTIQSIAPYFMDFYFNPDENGNLRLLWNDKYTTNIYGANDLSDGTIRFIALATLFLQPNLPQTIIIDEPELGLHPLAIAKLSGLIKSAAAKGCQIILATQSSDLIRYFEPEDIITVDQKDGKSEYHRLSTDELKTWLVDYSMDELWKQNIIQGAQP